ncbi:hypothetical protein DFS33DRAFT_1273548 [Desarmillaria ectypa]|nr:hypothetical protein DFS33DRAFT_1273548 [Desarmillaria ectypa]
MALFALEPQHLPPMEDYNSLYELAPFPFSSSDILDSVFPEPVLGLDQDGFLSMGDYQTDFIHTLDSTPTYDAFTPLFLLTQPATTPADVVPVISAPSVASDIQLINPNDEDADYDVDPDFVDDFATDPLPFAQCQSPVTSTPSSLLSSHSCPADMEDKDFDFEEPEYDESGYEEPESLSGSHKRGRVSELPATITIYRTDARQSRSKGGDFKNSLERYVFHDDPHHVRCMKPGCHKEFNSVNAAIDHMHVAHPCKKKPKTTNKSKATKNPKATRCVYFGCNEHKNSVGDMRRHLISEIHQCKRFRCGDCGGLFQRPDPVKRHQINFEGRCKETDLAQRNFDVAITIMLANQKCMVQFNARQES